MRILVKRLKKATEQGMLSRLHRFNAVNELNTKSDCGLSIMQYAESSFPDIRLWVKFWIA